MVLETTPKPSREQHENGPEDGAREALDSLAARPDRDPATGCFVKGNTAAGRTLARSDAFWQAVGAAKRELAERVCSDLAVNGDGAVTLEGLIDGYAETRLLRHAMFVRLAEQGGPVTGKGKARALFSSYLQALDRETRLAQTLGLERKAKAVSLADAIIDRQKAGA